MFGELWTRWGCSLTAGLGCVIWKWQKVIPPVLEVGSHGACRPTVLRRWDPSLVDGSLFFHDAKGQRAPHKLPGLFCGCRAHREAECPSANHLPEVPLRDHSQTLATRFYRFCFNIDLQRQWRTHRWNPWGNASVSLCKRRKSRYSLMYFLENDKHFYLAEMNVGSRRMTRKGSNECWHGEAFLSYYPDCSDFGLFNLLDWKDKK